MAALQDAAEERARLAEKEKEKEKQLALEEGGGKTSNDDAQDEAEREYNMHNARKKWINVSTGSMIKE